ncbi:pyridoxamine 5'-phosphate oxidase-domain-containing protein [Gongronella butleri]|nr:pyridoxamine 5'-phosphate oxidase-domain-containing protein [Gongronella butleri]
MALALTGPSVRTVVFRSFAGQHHADDLGWTSAVMVVTTDKRSKKYSLVQEDDRYEVAWYMGATQEQFRLRGNVFVYPDPSAKALEARRACVHDPTQHAVVAPADVSQLGNKAFLHRQNTEKTGEFDWEAERLRQFGQLDAVLRATFTDEPCDGALAITDYDEAIGKYVSPHQAALDDAYSNFCILLLTVDLMDYLSLAGEHRKYPGNE